MISVDCGITAVDEVALLQDAGIDVLITDHHLPRGDGVLPPTTILHPAVRGDVLVDPATAPCGAGVAAHLARALLDGAGQRAAGLLDGIAELSALATIADCVPLTGENRTLVREGLGALARTRRPGLRALLRFRTRRRLLARWHRRRVPALPATERRRPRRPGRPSPRAPAHRLGRRSRTPRRGDRALQPASP